MRGLSFDSGRAARPAAEKDRKSAQAILRRLSFGAQSLMGEIDYIEAGAAQGVPAATGFARALRHLPLFERRAELVSRSQANIHVYRSDF